MTEHRGEFVYNLPILCWVGSTKQMLLQDPPTPNQGDREILMETSFSFFLSSSYQPKVM